MSALIRLLRTTQYVKRTAVACPGRASRPVLHGSCMAKSTIRMALPGKRRLIISELTLGPAVLIVGACSSTGN